MFRALLQKFNDLKLRGKLIVAFLLVVAFPIAIVGLILTEELRSLATEDAKLQSEINIERVNQRVNQILRIPIHISNHLQFDRNLNQLVNTEYQHTYEVVQSYQNYLTFENYLQFYSEISNIRFYMDNPTLLNNWSFIPLTNEIADTNWYVQSTQEKGLIGWHFISDETNHHQSYLSLTRKIYFIDNQTSGMLVININPDQLHWILNQESYLTLLIDESQQVISSNDQTLIGKNIDSVMSLEEIKEKEESIYTGIVNGEASQIMFKPLVIESSYNDLTVVSVISTKHIEKDANYLRSLGMVITFIGIIFALLLIIVVSWLLTKRLGRLSFQIKRVSEGDLDSSVFVDGKDEIGQLSAQFNQMVRNINGLIEQVQETTEQKNTLEQKQNEMKLRLLASQINPHFLFNTLESIRMKAHMQGQKEIASIVKMLGKLMRKSIEVSGSKISLQDELEMITCYLEIQTFRYEQRLQYSIEVDESLEDWSIQPLLIQPLVENAVIHGLEDKEEGGFVTIKVTATGNNVLIAVQDDGIGMSNEKINEIKQTLNKEEDESARIGLRNVDQRLRITYGQESRLKIESLEGKGTLIHFLIPKGD
ncbi:histidine kinase [Bacillus sp. TS-2]|nr:histidine kinase [Bacillus sp. TS-2]